MCNLYRLRSAAAEVAHTFDAEADEGANYDEEVYPGYNGLVVVDGRVQAMTWGFPRPMKGRNGQPIKPKAVTNAREDKLQTWFWRDSFERRRCLIPVTAWAEPQGEDRRMTRTWYAPAGETLFAIGGIWRRSDEWGDVYSMVMVDSSPQMADVHDRMPVILRREDWTRWIDAPADEAFGLCRTWPGELAVDATDQPWVARRGAAAPRLI